MTLTKQSAQDYIAKNKFRPSKNYYSSLRNCVDELAVGLGFHLVPVIPGSGIFLQDGKDGARGKAPSFWAVDGSPHLLSAGRRATYKTDHTASQPAKNLLNAISTAEKLKAPLGLGCLGCPNHAFLDFDSKNWGVDADGNATEDAKAACADAVEGWLKEHDLLDTYREITPTGGWHVGLQVRSLDTRMRFTINAEGFPAFAGEVLWEGSHCVVAPTVNGKGPYKAVGPLRFKAIGSLDEVGVTFCGSSSKEDLEGVEVVVDELEERIEALRRPHGTSGVPRLSDLCRSMSRSLLQGGWRTDKRFLKGDTKQPDRSKVLTVVIKEGVAWYKWLDNHRLPFVDDLFGDPLPDQELNLLQTLVADLEVADKFGRVLDSCLRGFNKITLLNRTFSDHQAQDRYKGACSYGGGASGEQLKASEVDTAAKLVRFLHQVYGNRLRFNALSKLVELDGRPLPDPELAYIALEEDFGVEVPKVAAIDALLRAAKAHTYSPPEDYLNVVRTLYLSTREVDPDVSLIPVEEIGTRYFSISDPFQSMLLGKQLMACVDRAYEPGCVHQTVLVMRGRQGLGKSTSLAALMPERELCASSDEVPGQKDLLQSFQSNWIYEFEEMDRLTRTRSAAALKALISRSHDNFRAPYERVTRNNPRVAVLFGSTNEDVFLDDPTGLRRYWVVDVDNPIDVARIAADRELIWASVLHARDQGDHRQITPDQYKASAENAATASRKTLLLSTVEGYIGKKPWITEQAILLEALGLEVSDLCKTGPRTGSHREVVEALKILGWSRAKNGIRELFGKPELHGVWFAPNVEHTRSAKKALKLYAEHEAPLPVWSPFLKRVVFAGATTLSSRPPELPPELES